MSSNLNWTNHLDVLRFYLKIFKVKNTFIHLLRRKCPQVNSNIMSEQHRKLPVGFEKKKKKKTGQLLFLSLVFSERWFISCFSWSVLTLIRLYKNVQYRSCSEVNSLMIQVYSVCFMSTTPLENKHTMWHKGLCLLLMRTFWWWLQHLIWSGTGQSADTVYFTVKFREKSGGNISLFHILYFQSTLSSFITQTGLIKSHH